MEKLTINLGNVIGKIKPMNAVNNGPVGNGVRGISNCDCYKKLEIPYARNHDASFAAVYGGEHTVDVHRIFKNFDADENDPKNYLFKPTDLYCERIESVGTKVFYRLGASIEHYHKSGTYPPKDYAKWARICEHVIRHYTEGWANGYKLDIEYWEIWNEPDCKNYDGTNPCWQGTDSEFIDFFEVSAKYLKSKFPHLKIGGPSFCSSDRSNSFRREFLKAVKERNIPLDFYSFHGYIKNPSEIFWLSSEAVASFKELDMPCPELIYNEWNYVRGWLGEAYIYSHKMSKLNKGASLIAGAMCAGQKSDIDMMMYYDARPGGWCGMFDSDLLYPLKGYYPFLFFKDLVKLSGYVESIDCKNVYSIAATDGKNGAILLTHYFDEDSTPTQKVKIDINGITGNTRVEFYLLDDNHDGVLVREERFSSNSFAVYLDMKLYDTYFIKLIAE